MKTRILVRFCSILEIAMGLALIVNSAFVAQMFFVISLHEVAIMRGAGIAPLLLGPLSWMYGYDIPPQILLAQLTYHSPTSILVV
jgi:hypothetical protein